MVMLNSGGNAYLIHISTIEISHAQGCIDLPRPERDEEAPPREEEHPAILVDRVQHWYASRLLIHWIDDWTLPETRNCHHLAK